MVLELLEDMLINNHLIAAENKAAVAIIKQLETHEIDHKAEQLYQLLHPPQVQPCPPRTSFLYQMRVLRLGKSSRLPTPASIKSLFPI
jgi:hypothetical protein